MGRHVAPPGTTLFEASTIATTLPMRLTFVQMELFAMFQINVHGSITSLHPSNRQSNGILLIELCFTNFSIARM
jgi:hypothetical protein